MKDSEDIRQAKKKALRNRLACRKGARFSLRALAGTALEDLKKSRTLFTKLRHGVRFVWYGLRFLGHHVMYLWLKYDFEE